ncbi:cation-translocating P-type ATPase [Chelativorans sp. AA-79]|uniref:cation-translocating P-type ATPase n=1 Tax=Chelativorans sp. AA-79 TaxID=3028735 RepID=UPI0023F7E26A|nr:cation-translocating P-type ATPase [Chelativorans sp. AA-79]WEX08617.1 cation-translocating P-type ATPase [Chelativorans sp. AA-79]
MSCCAPIDLAADAGRTTAREELRLASRDLGGGLHETDIAVPEVHCAGCIHTVEMGLAKLPGVEQVRVNLSSKRVGVQWRGDTPPDLLTALGKLGFPGHLTGNDDDKADPELQRLIRALAVAGFCAMNIMLLSVSVWSGADATTRHAFHWIAAGLALSCLLYSGRIFFTSAWVALRSGRTNMDVPISIGVCMAFGLSLYDTIDNGPHAYFDAATALIFFLLIGRTLEHLMREKARSAVHGLIRLAPRGATVLRGDGRRDYLPTGEIEPGMRIAIAAGERVPVDAVVEDGASELDCAIITGESEPQRVASGSTVRAGTLNLSGPLVIRASVSAGNSFLAEMVKLMEAAEGGRARYRRLADRAAALYSPVVHSVAFLTFLGWILATGDWHRAITIAIAVLIITCPCALGLAVPMVQMVAARRLFENRIMVKDGSALERMAEIDTVVFDKTGTLTLGRPSLIDADTIAPRHFAIAGLLASHSIHPLSRAIAKEAPVAGHSLSDVVERPGLGIEARVDAVPYRLGRAGWALGQEASGQEEGTVLAREGQLVARFRFDETPRPQATDAVDTLRGKGLRLAILSGDGADAVANISRELRIDDAVSGLLPAEKVERLDTLAREGRKVLMVGDGLNDAPALAASHVSMAPASAADIGRNAADFVFLRDGLDAVPMALDVSRAAGRLVRQNFVLAIAYNAVALPIALAGHVTPLIAALAMSFSSILVVANALRLRAGSAAPRKSRLVGHAPQDALRTASGA